MIETFLRRPATPLEFGADTVRLAGLVGVPVGGVLGGPAYAGVLALVLLGVLVPRAIGVRAALDILSGLALLVAGWSAVLDLYAAIAWWDLVVHLTATGVIAAVAFLALERVDAVPPPRSRRGSTVLLVTALGLAASAVWEMLEWLGHNLVDESIFVAYDDTIGDMTMGGIGSVLAGLVVAAVPLLVARPPAAPDPGDEKDGVGDEKDGAGD